MSRALEARGAVTFIKDSKIITFFTYCLRQLEIRDCLAVLRCARVLANLSMFHGLSLPPIASRPKLAKLMPRVVHA